MRGSGSCLETAGIAVFALLLGAFAASTWMQHAGGGGEPAEDGSSMAPDAPPSVRTRIRIEVRNGSGQPGAAQSMTAFLRDRGFDVVDYGNADTFDHERTEIVAHGDDPAGARTVAAMLPGVPIRPAEESSPYLDVTVILGEDMDRILGDAGVGPDEGTSDGWADRMAGWLDRLPLP